ncbi:hypothetical protein I79_000411 [Cricetulus griseus]|uniref:Uncharacterized protein n=1 Tax=Cricetulus griseus TaxID=10029 RepID=G3GS94_CRIGR|nr:hypothetical protein I79_000411 [Cricetulus griseus]
MNLIQLIVVNPWKMNGNAASLAMSRLHFFFVAHQRNAILTSPVNSMPHQKHFIITTLRKLVAKNKGV